MGLNPDVKDSFASFRFLYDLGKHAKSLVCLVYDDWM